MKVSFIFNILEDLIDDMEKELKGVKINQDLFQDDENLDELNDIGDDDEDNNPKDEIEEEEKEG
jgi:hypothetical protein